MAVEKEEVPLDHLEDLAIDRILNEAPSINK